MKDKELERKLLNMMLKLERKIDCIAPTELRHLLSAQLVSMRIDLKEYKQHD